LHRYGAVPRMDSILLTVSTCSFDLFLFFIMFSIIMFGFTAAFYIAGLAHVMTPPDPQLKGAWYP
jgi:hypothetical protein